ncbi:MAG TPA: hypothetical protein PKO23_17305, partial [Candidatus Hydrogenedentes bacterium]|nr:hypothetical protein [Candidatus Hydrogenedentota bacterium]
MCHSKSDMFFTFMITLIVCFLIDFKVNAEIEPLNSAYQTSTSDDIYFIYHVDYKYVNRLLLVGVSWKPHSNDIIGQITYGGRPLLPVGRASGNGLIVDLYYLVNPPVGDMLLAVDFLSTHRGACVGAVTFAGVNQTTPLGSFIGTHGSGVRPLLTIASNANDVVLDTLVTDKNTDLAMDPGQLELWKLNQNVDTIRAGGSWKDASTTGTTTQMGWNLNAAKNWVIGGISIKPVICNDGVDCTTETYSMEQGCIYTPNASLCADGISCTTDVCDPVQGCQHTPDNGACNDSIACTTDTCDPV